jgi:multiple sugar transport system substrate-binding protein
MKPRLPWLFELLFAASLALVMLPGCGDHPARKQRRITSIHCIGGYSDAARVLAADFKKQTGIHVEVVEAAFLPLREKEITDLVNGAGRFDVMQIAYQWEGEIFPLLKPLDEIAPGLTMDLEDFIKPVRENCGQWEGKVYALPTACDAVTLLYRTDIFEARSAEYEQATGKPLRPPATWEEYVEIARFLNSETIYGNLVRGEQCSTVWTGIFFGMGGELLDEHWRPLLNSEAGVSSLSMLVEMCKYSPRPQETPSLVENTSFLQGRGAMVMTWPSLLWADMANSNHLTVAGKIGAAVIPGARPELSSWSISINPASKDIDAAAKWIQFLVSPETTKRMLLEYGKGSPRVSTYSDPDCKRKIFYHSQLLEGLANCQPRLRIPPSQEMTDYLDAEIARAMRGETTPRAAMDRTAARWREILTRAGYLKD